jgi:predicted flap endonuclease-1-like 5' DNA nuclease
MRSGAPLPPRATPSAPSSPTASRPVVVPPSAPLPAEASAGRIEQLEQQLEQIKRVLSRKQIELSQFSTERDTFTARINERDARIRELEAELAKRSADNTSADERARLTARVRELELELQRRAAAEASSDQRADLERRVRDLQAQVARDAQTVAELRQELSDALAWQPPAEDDLKRINGIGPAFERALKSLGVRTFEQIAAWTPEDVASMAGRLKVNPGRILRDDWVASARNLARRQ